MYVILAALFTTYPMWTSNLAARAKLWVQGAKTKATRERASVAQLAVAAFLAAVQCVLVIRRKEKGLYQIIHISYRRAL